MTETLRATLKEQKVRDTRLVQSGVDLYRVKDLLGHKD